MKRFFALLLLMNILSDVNADKCSLWMAEMVNNDTAVCHSEIVSFDVILQNDSMYLDSCLYEWFLQVPEGDFVSQGVNRFSTFTYTFNQSGVYHITCQVKPDTCNYVSSDTIAVTVYSKLKSGAIFNEDIICYNTQPNVIQSLSLPTGCDGQYVYQWQDSVSGGFWRDIPNSNNITYQAGNLTETTYFRRKVTNVLCSETAYTQPVCINVMAPLMAGSIHYGDTICYNIQPNAIQSVSLPTGCDGQYVYQWQDSVPGSSWRDIPNSDYITYQPGNLIETTFFRRKVSNVLCSETAYTQPVCVNVLAPLTAGSIHYDDTICYNIQPNVIQSLSLPTGCDGQYVYQWQDSISGGTWRDISNSDSTIYQPGNLTETTYYRRKVTNILCSETAYTQLVCVKVRSLINAPVISQYIDTICYDSIPSYLSIIEPSIAGIGDTIRYQWQDSIEGGNWTNIQNATDLRYQPSALQTTHFYRVIATSDKGCGIFTSNVTEIVVLENLQISVQAPQVPLCHSTLSDIVVSATGAGGEYSYQWQDSINGIWNNIGLNDSTYSFVAESEGMKYLRCIVASVKGCSYVVSPVIALQSYSELNAGSIILLVDTVCYGTQPDMIQSVDLANGCDGVFTYSWEKSVDGESWNNIPNSNNASFQPPVLMQNTYYRRKVYNAYCNVAAYTDYVLVIIRQDLTVPVIGQYLDTICFNAVPDLLEIVTPSICGVGDTVLYQWQDSVAAETWKNINGATGLTCQPTSLTNSRYYRVVATSEKGCGMYVSNTVKINVYPDLVIVNNPVDTICYMTSTQLTFTATGEGERYSYQWQESSDSITFTDIRNEKRSDYWTDDKPDGKFYYRCIVTPKNGCSVDTSDVFVVNVYEELKPGKIGSGQVVCKNEDASELTFITLPDGGETNRYTYQWEYSVDMTDWYNVQNETSTSYTPRNMQQTTYYRVKVRNSCGLDYTDTVEILVNPLPDTVIISGNQYVCYNKYEYYEIPEMMTGFDYQWSLDNPNAGEIITDPFNKTQIQILWIAANSGANIVLTVTNTETGCLSRNYYPVATSNEMTPDTTIIVRKPNSNIFVCQDSITDHYQWGSTEKSSGNETMFENSDRRYCQVEGGIDTTNYIYWLDLWNGDTSRCISRSIYSPSNDEKYIHQPRQNIRVVSSINGYISFEIDNPSSKNVNVTLYSIAGMNLMKESFGNDIAIKAHVPIDIPAGVYVLRVEIGTDCETFKLIAE